MKTFLRVAAIIIILSGIVLAVIFLGKKDSRPRQDHSNSIVVSILPLKGILEQLVGDDVRIQVLVPPGSSPETYEPTPQQLVGLSEADLIFTTGLLDFEQELIAKTTEGSENKVINLSEGIHLLSGCCGGASHDHHNHGIDPHIWTSPRQLKIIARNMFNALMEVIPEQKKGEYGNSYEILQEKLDSLDRQVENRLKESHIKNFFIYHPALTYYANDYNLNQISIEQEGKEPSAEQLMGLIKTAREDRIGKILYQKEFSRSVIETVSRDIGAVPVEIDPLAEDIFGSILFMTDQIASHER